jgi:hydrogenase 3 maturation protease
MRLNIEDALKRWLKGYSKLVILGIGNPLRGDDSLGLEIVKRLRGKLPKNVTVIEGGLTPENFIGKIKKIKPSHVLLVDAAHFGGEPGEIRLIRLKQTSGVTISTHSISLSVLAELIRGETNAKIMLLGIEPGNLNLGVEISPEIEEAIEWSVNVITNIIVGNFTVHSGDNGRFKVAGKP